MNEEKYISGFNSGYILAGHKPELLQTVTEHLPPTNDYVAGLMDGKGQLEQEKIQEQVEELSVLHNLNNNRERGIERE